MERVRSRRLYMRGFAVTAVLVSSLALAAEPPTTAPAAAAAEACETSNPVREIGKMPLGHDLELKGCSQPPDAKRARLGRWLFYDGRLSADGHISCGTCHRPDFGFSEAKPVSSGINGQKGTRKAPSFLNAAFAFYPETFWDGRAGSLEEQAKGPIANPIEMGNTHEKAAAAIAAVKGYARFFKDAFGDEKVTIDRIAAAIADYERTRVSGNSPWDRWKKGGDEKAVSAQVKLGDSLFFGKANCNRCHVGNAFTDSRFHNLGIGWDAATKRFADEGRSKITKKDEDRGAFKTPGLRETALHPPYMHDGSVPDLKAVMLHYKKGGTANPHLSSKLEAVDLTGAEIDALVAMMEALNGEGYQDIPPEQFPQ